jgi:chitin disaccharide deacetylase
MLIINADDWGRSRTETDAALSCYKKGRITSVTAMVYMDDSIRSAKIAMDEGIDVGLHLNLTQKFSNKVPMALRQNHDQIISFLTFHKFSGLIYNPFLKTAFQAVYQAQFDEFIRLYGRNPSHIDGHHHQHLCANLLVDKIIPKGRKVRRNFYFWPGEKGIANRTYRLLVDRWLKERYLTTDFFFALSQCFQNERLLRVIELAATSHVEIMTHPAKEKEHAYLMSQDFLTCLNRIEKGTYSLI